MTAGFRPVRAPRGTQLSALGWQQEAPLRMLMNNLDPEVAERPADLVVRPNSSCCPGGSCELPRRDFLAAVAVGAAGTLAAAAGRFLRRSEASAVPRRAAGRDPDRSRPATLRRRLPHRRTAPRRQRSQRTFPSRDFVAKCGKVGL